MIKITHEGVLWKWTVILWEWIYVAAAVLLPRKRLTLFERRLVRYQNNRDFVDEENWLRTAKSLIGLRGTTAHTDSGLPSLSSVCEVWRLAMTPYCQVSNRSPKYDGSPDFVNGQRRRSRKVNRPEHESSPLIIQRQYLSE